MNGPTLRKIIDGARENLKAHVYACVEELDAFPTDLDVLIWELANGGVPVYYSEMVDLIREDVSLMLDEPEREHKTPLDGIQFNVHDRIESALCEYLSELENEYLTEEVEG